MSRTSLVIVLAILGGIVPAASEAGIDFVIGGAAHSPMSLAKQFTVDPRTTVTGVEFISNDKQTGFPRVRIIRRVGESIADADVLAERVSVSESRHRVRVSFPGIHFEDREDVLVVITLPPGAAPSRIGTGAGIGATLSSGPTSSFLVQGEGELLPLEGELAIRLLHDTSKASEGPQSSEAVAPLETFFRVRSPSRAGAPIQFGLSRPGAVQIRVYDVAGRQVWHRRESLLAAGTHTLRLDRDGAHGNPFPAGLYFARFEGDGKEITARLVILP